MNFKISKSRPLFQRFAKQILNLDGFGCPVQLLLKGDEQHKTLFGGSMTISFTIITFIYLYQLIFQMIYRENPQVLTNTLFNENPDLTVLDMKSFFFAFAIQDLSTWVEYKNDSLFDVDFHQCTKRTLVNTTTNQDYDSVYCEELPVGDCSFQKHIQIDSIKSFYEKKPMNSFFCIDADYWTQHPPVLQGTFDNDLYTWIQIQVTSCTNDTHTKCAPQEEIDRLLGAGYFEVFLSDSVADFTSPNDPYSQIGRTVYDSFSAQQTKAYDLFFRQLLTSTDTGYVKSSIENNRAISQSKYQSMVLNTMSKTFLSLSLRLETKIDVTNRYYYKVQDICGIIGGFWQTLALLGLLIAGPINRLDFQIKLINQLFNFEISSEEEQAVSRQEEDVEIQNKPKTLSSSKESKVTASNQTNQLNIVIKQQNEPQLVTSAYNTFREYIESRINPKSGFQRITQFKKSDTKDFKKFIKLKFGKLKLNTVEYIAYFVNCAKKYKAKKNQINFAMNQIVKEIDIVQILKRQTDIEKLKMLLLSEQQLKLFEYLPRPCIPLEVQEGSVQKKYEELLQASTDKKMQFWQTLQRRKTLKQRAYEAYEAYDKILRSGHLSDIDHKLIQFLDSNIRQLFEVFYDQNTSAKEQDFIVHPPSPIHQIISSYRDEIDLEENRSEINYIKNLDTGDRQK